MKRVTTYSFITLLALTLSSGCSVVWYGSPPEDYDVETAEAAPDCIDNPLPLMADLGLVTASASVAVIPLIGWGLFGVDPSPAAEIGAVSTAVTMSSLVYGVNRQGECSILKREFRQRDEAASLAVPPPR